MATEHEITMEPVHHAFCNHYLDRECDCGLDALRVRVASLEELEYAALEVQKLHQDPPDYCATWTPCQCPICTHLRNRK